MRKRIINPVEQDTEFSEQEGLDVQEIARVEITSEDEQYPVEEALLPGMNRGWRAAEPGKQIIRLLFDSPQALQRISLKFEETDIERMQEYVLQWSPDNGQSFQEIARQQWNFSPQGATTETENHSVDIQAATVLELIIIPDTSGGGALASLAWLRLE